MTEGERIRHLRKDVLKLTLDKFSRPLGVSRSAISDIEGGRNALSNQMVMLLRKIYNVSEEWLRSGEGEIFKKADDEERVADIADYIIDLDPESDEFRLYELLKKLDEKQIAKILQIAEILAK
jgi:transcriptional regulator with XRE-family HTH domain